MNEHERHRDELYEHFGDKQLPESLKHELDTDSDLKREWEELQAIEEALPDEASFGVSDAELDALCAAVDEKIDTANITSVRRYRFFTPTWQRTLALAATLVLVAIGSLLFNHYQPAEQTAVRSNTTDYTSALISGDDVEMSDPMYNALLMNYTSGSTAEPASLLLNDLTDAEMKYLQKNFDVDELML